MWNSLNYFVYEMWFQHGFCPVVIIPLHYSLFVWTIFVLITSCATTHTVTYTNKDTRKLLLAVRLICNSDFDYFIRQWWSVAALKYFSPGVKTLKERDFLLAFLCCPLWSNDPCRGILNSSVHFVPGYTT